MPEGDTVYRVAQQQHRALAGKALGNITNMRLNTPPFLDEYNSGVGLAVARAHKIPTWAIVIWIGKYGVRLNYHTVSIL